MSKGLRQPSLRCPLREVGEERAIELGAVGLRCRATLHIDVSRARPAGVEFVVDSGASMSFIGLEFARSRGIPVPPPHVETALNLTAATGTQAVRVRPGRIRLWWNAERAGYPFDWPVLFRPGLPLTVPPLLGLGGVIATCRWTFDGQYDPDTPFGHVLFDDSR